MGFSIGLSQERLKELLEYDPLTGDFTWKISVGGRSIVGTIAGSLVGSGYISIQIGGISYLAHNLAWFYIHGEWSKVDHEDRRRWNNKLINLRKANSQNNAANRECVSGNTGIKGVHLRNGKYEVGIKVNQKRIHLGVFRNLEEAKEAYVTAAIKYFGEFAVKD